MSDASTGQIVGGIIGAYFGYPQLGIAIGGAIDPPDGPSLEGPQLSDLSVQTSSYGAPIANIDASIGTMGQVIWVENNSIMERSKKENQGGKGGGGGATVKTYEYFATFAVLMADHEIDGIGTLRLGNQLLLNTQIEDFETQIATSETLANVSALSLGREFGLASLGLTQTGPKAVLYPGYDDQPIDPRMEAHLGTANCPAYRGCAYIVFYDWPLEKLGNTLGGAQARAEIINGSSQNAPVLLSEIIVDDPLSAGSGIDQVCNYLNSEAAVVWVVDNNITGLFYSQIVFGIDGYSKSGYVKYTPDHVASGWSDVAVLPQSSNFFDNHPSVVFSPTLGRIIRKGGLTIGVHWSTGRLYKAIGSVSTPSTPWYAAIDDSGNIYAITSSGISKYDSDLVLVDTKAITFPGETYTAQSVSACFDSGLIYVGFTGGGADIVRNIYAVDFDAELKSDVFQLTVTPANNNKNSVFTVNGAVLTRFYSIDNNPTYQVVIDRWRLPTLLSNGKSLAEICQERMEKSELIESGDIDVSLLTQTVSGFRTAGVQSIRGQIGPLQAAYNFDIIASGYQLKSVPRGLSPVMTIPYEHLGATQSGTVTALKHNREMDTQLPNKVLIKYLDKDRDYDINVQPSPERASSSTVNVMEVDLPIVLTPDLAAGIAETAQYKIWLERETFEFTLPQIYQALEAADVVTIETDYASFEIQITSINELTNGILQCEGKLSDPALYVPEAVGGQGVTNTNTIPYASPSIMHLLDIPTIRDEDDVAGFAAALCGSSAGWPGGVIFRSTDSGQTFTDVQAYPDAVFMGECDDSLPQHDGNVIDYINTLTVSPYSNGQTLSSLSETQMMTGKNWCAYGAAGRWEIMRFANATLNADGTYTLDTFVRGRKGTEQYTSDHVDGDVFVFLSDLDMGFISANISDLNVSRIYRGVTQGKDIDNVADTDFTYTGINLKPLSPVHLSGAIDGSNNWDLAWKRRSRLSSSWWSNGIESSIGESSESYEIDIMNGSTVVRTLTSTTQTVEYSSADQVTDFGGNQNTLKFRVYQMSATVGRGYVAEITI